MGLLLFIDNLCGLELPRKEPSERVSEGIAREI